MSKYRVWFVTNASASVEVEIDDSQYDDEYELSDALIDAAYKEHLPAICAQCGGWGRDFTLDMGEWQIEETQDDDGIGGILAVRIED